MLRIKVKLFYILFFKYLISIISIIFLFLMVYTDLFKSKNLEFLIVTFILIFNIVIAIIYNMPYDILLIISGIFLELAFILIKKININLFDFLFNLYLFFMVIIFLIDIVRFLIFKFNKNNKIIDKKDKIEILHYLFRYKIFKLNKLN